MKLLRAAIPLLIICALAIGVTTIRGAAFTPAYLSLTAFGGLTVSNWSNGLRSFFCTRCGSAANYGPGGAGYQGQWNGTGFDQPTTSQLNRWQGN